MKQNFKTLRSKTVLHCLSLEACFEGGRMAVGAVSVAYLSARGISTSQIALLKMLQAILLIAGELPTGAISDLYGRKNTLLLSVLSSLISLSLYCWGTLFPHFLVAEAFAAFSLCLWSGCYEAYCVDRLVLEKNRALNRVYWHLNLTANQTIVAVVGLVGGWSASQSYRSAYFVAIGIFAALLVNLLFSPSSAVQQAEVGGSFIGNIMEQIGASIKSCQSDRRLLFFFGANIFIQFAIQPLFHYWQLLLLLKNSTLSPKILGLAFFSYCVCTAVANAFVARMVNSDRTEKKLFNISSLIFASGYIVLGLPNTNWIIALIVLCVVQSALAIVRAMLVSEAQPLIKSEVRATVLSSISLVSRLGMLASLGMIYLFSRFLTIEGIFLSMGVCAFATIIFWIFSNQFGNSIYSPEPNL